MFTFHKLKTILQLLASMPSYNEYVTCPSINIFRRLSSLSLGKEKFAFVEFTLETLYLQLRCIVS